MKTFKAWLKMFFEMEKEFPTPEIDLNVYIKKEEDKP